MTGRNRTIITAFAVILNLFVASQAFGMTTLAGVRWEKAQQYRFWGRVDLSYRNYVQELNNVRSEENSFYQDYRVGMSGYVWRPKFMIFSSELSLGAAHTEYDSGSLDSRNVNFNIDTVVFPRTLFPLIVSAARNTNHLEGELTPGYDLTSTFFNIRWNYPIFRGARLLLDYSHVIADIDHARTGSSSMTTDTFTADIAGSYAIRQQLNVPNVKNKRNLNEDTGNNNDDNDNDNAGPENNNGGQNNADQKMRNNQGRGVMKRNFYSLIGITNWGAIYEFKRIDTEGRHFVNFGDTTSHRFRLFAHRPVWVFTGYGEVGLYKSEDTKSYHLALNLERYTERFLTYNTYTAGVVDDSEKRDVSHQFNSNNIYWYSRELSFSGEFSYNRRYYRDTVRPQMWSSRVFGKETVAQTYSLNLGANYSRYLTNHFFQAYINSGFYDSSQSTMASNDNNSYYANYGLTLESLPKVFKTFGYHYKGEYLGSYSKGGGSSNRLVLGFDVSKHVRRLSLVNQVQFFYNFSSDRDNNTRKGYGLSLKSTAYLKLNAYSTLSGTVEYSTTRDDRGVSTNTLAFRENFSFVLYKKLMLNIGASQWETKGSDNSRTRYYDVLSSLDYRLRQVYIHGEYNLSNQEEDRGDTIRKRTIFLRVTRPFGR